MRWLMVVVAALALAAGCKRRSSDGGAITNGEARVAGARVAAGSLREPTIEDVRWLIVRKGADVEAVRRDVEQALRARTIAIVEKAPPDAPSIVAAVAVRTVDDAGFHPSLLPYLGHGLSDADVAALTAATELVELTLTGPAAQVAELQHTGAAIALAVARSRSAWIGEPQAGTTATADWFATSFGDGVPPDDFPLDVRDLIVVEQVNEGEYMFLETNGMVRFGLPDLFLRGFPRTYGDDMAMLVNAAAQTLVERGGLARDGVLEVRFDALETPRWPATAEKVAADDGTGAISFRAIWSHGDDHDVEGPPTLVELLLPGTGEVAARTYDAVKTLRADVEADMIYAQHDDAELTAARDRARAAFAALAPHFAHGVPDLEMLSVKASFPTDDGGAEWMWVEIESWRGDVLTGTLVNEPFAPSKVHAGDRVTVSAAEIFDYTHRTADGKTAGGETTEILLRREAP